MTQKPRIGNCYGMVVHPMISGETWIDGEQWCTDYGQFRRRGVVRHAVTGNLVAVRCDVADTYFSIPATTATEHGYVTSRDDGAGFEFRPHTVQDQSPADYRKSVKQAYK